MREIRTSGLMSEEGKPSAASRSRSSALPRLSCACHWSASPALRFLSEGNSAGSACGNNFRSKNMEFAVATDHRTGVAVRSRRSPEPDSVATR
jgi:hypothetical protein